ncbi:hypothetical protein N9L68_02115 [bacterium]|nr:hypothetical protein [bacterium]
MQTLKASPPGKEQGASARRERKSNSWHCSHELAWWPATACAMLINYEKREEHRHCCWIFHRNMEPSAPMVLMHVLYVVHYFSDISFLNRINLIIIPLPPEADRCD